MAYDSNTKTITRDYRFGTAEDAEAGDKITQSQMDSAFDDVVEDVNEGLQDLSGAINESDQIILDARDASIAAKNEAVAAKDAAESSALQNSQSLSKDFPKPSRTVVVEQFLTGLQGRGMLAEEANNIVSEGTIVTAYSAGVDALSVSNNANFTVGGMCMIRHDNGIYDSYTVHQIGAGTIAIAPSLRYPVSAGAAIERLWFNRAHPGKFYMRYLAQRIARSFEQDVAISNGSRCIFSYFDSNPNTDEDTLKPVGSATINYYDATSESAGAGHAPRFNFGRSAYIGVFASGDGAETNLFEVKSGKPMLAKVSFVSMVSSSSYNLKILDEDNNQLAVLNIPAGVDTRAPQILTLPFSTQQETQLKVRIEAQDNPGSYFIMDMVDVFESPETSGQIIAGPAPKIVCLGDSWIAGDLVSTAEREPITTQLALELPHASIINAGIGGQKVQDMLARFDTDVTPHNPQYVVVNTGTNDAYNPESSVFDPNSIDFFISQYLVLIERIKSIGARPVIIGVPALAEDDPQTTYVDWALNDRARKYVMEFNRRLSPQPLISGKKAGSPLEIEVSGGVLEGANYPKPHIDGVSVWDVDFDAAVTITGFQGGVPNQVLTLRGVDGTTEIVHGNELFWQDGANFVLPVGGTAKFRKRFGATVAWDLIYSSFYGDGSSVQIDTADVTVSSGNPNVSGARVVSMQYPAAQSINATSGWTPNQRVTFRNDGGSDVTFVGGPSQTFKTISGGNVVVSPGFSVDFIKATSAGTGAWYQVH